LSVARELQAQAGLVERTAWRHRKCVCPGQLVHLELHG
jgi:hypothetical protein